MRFREELNLDFSLSFCSGSVPCLPWGDKGAVGRGTSVCLCAPKWQRIGLMEHPSGTSVAVLLNTALRKVLILNEAPQLLLSGNG